MGLNTKRDTEFCLDDARFLFECILSLESVDECKRFFEDACTMTELEALLQRVEVARDIKKGKKYADIITDTGASSATVSRVKKCFKYGAKGYSLVLDRVCENEGENK